MERWNALSDIAYSNLPRMTLPLSKADARALKLGDTVLLDGEVTVTAGFPAQQRLLTSIQDGVAPPFPMAGGAFFHLGGSCRLENGHWVTNYVNPTTSTRFDAIMPAIIRGLGLTSTGGKGGMGQACVKAMQETGCVYFSMPGGASPLLSKGAVERLETGWDDLIEQFRLSRFRLAGFGPVTVAIDAHGNSMFDQLQAQAASRMPEILAGLEHARQDAASKLKPV
jgi:fumarate hydratase subunit beta